jgi:hypothetical protein
MSGIGPYGMSSILKANESMDEYIKMNTILLNLQETIAINI